MVEGFGYQVRKIKKNGGLETEGQVTFSGYGIFIVDGMVTLNHNVETTGTIAKSTVGFYANGVFTMAYDGLRLAAQILVDGNVNVVASAKIIGSLTRGQRYARRRLAGALPPGLAGAYRAAVAFQSRDGKGSVG